MSYILDALRRAEAERERERGAVPSLHSPGGALGSLPAASLRPAAPSSTWRLAVVGGALALLGVLLGLWWAGSRSPAAGQLGAPPLAAQAPAVADQAGVAPSAPAAVAAAAPLRLPTPPLAPVPAASPAPPPAPETPAAVAKAQAGPDDAPVPAPAPAPAPAPPSAEAAAPGAAPAAARSPPVALASLSAELRAAWPPLVVGGSIYSDNPGSRFIIANGQVVREGERAAPGVVVERIGRGSVVLLWRGLRVEVPV